MDWAALGVSVMLECSGEHLTRAALQPFFDRGCTKVVVSAPVKDATAPVLNIVYGVNHELYNAANDAIVTAASCTTNCLAPVVKVVLERLGIVHGCITTVHNVTNTQVCACACGWGGCVGGGGASLGGSVPLQSLPFTATSLPASLTLQTVVDAPNSKKSDLRRARSALCNLAPTSTGSATAIALIFPGGCGAALLPPYMLWVPFMHDAPSHTCMHPRALTLPLLLLPLPPARRAQGEAQRAGHPSAAAQRLHHRLRVCRQAPHHRRGGQRAAQGVRVPEVVGGGDWPGLGGGFCCKCESNGHRWQPLGPRTHHPSAAAVPPSPLPPGRLAGWL